MAGLDFGMGLGAFAGGLGQGITQGRMMALQQAALKLQQQREEMLDRHYQAMEDQARQNAHAAPLERIADKYPRLAGTVGPAIEAVRNPSSASYQPTLSDQSLPAPDPVSLERPEQQPVTGQAAVAPLIRNAYSAAGQAAKQDYETQLGFKRRELDLRAKQVAATAASRTPSFWNATDPKMIAQGIMNGDQPPDLTGMYRYGGPIRAELERQGYDLTAANLDWQAAKRHIASLNSPQQLRLRQAIGSLPGMLDNIEDLYDRWQKTGAASGLKAFNRASLATAKNLPGEAGEIAQTLETQINDAVAEMGQVYMSGNTPTDHALRLAASNLSADWNEQQFRSALKMLRKNIQIRSNSITHSMPAGASGENPYYRPTAAGPGAAPAAQTGGAAPATPGPIIYKGRVLDPSDPKASLIIEELKRRGEL